MKQVILRVLIVDDEHWIGTLIQNLINWDALGMECAGTARSGEAAYEILQREIVDIVITDIRMPRMNGLELIQAAKEAEMELRFVVISGFKEFEYARKALQYGVKDYLLKPINEDEINNVLSSIRRELLTTKQANADLHEMQKFLVVNQQVLHRETMLAIENGKPESWLNQLPDFVHGKSVFQALDIKLDYLDFSEKESRQDAITIDKVIQRIEECSRSQKMEYLAAAADNLHIRCLLCYADAERLHIPDLIHALQVSIEELLLGFESYAATTGVGTATTDPAQINHSLRIARYATDQRLLAGAGRWIELSAKTPLCLEWDAFWAPRQRLLSMAVELSDREKLAEEVDAIFSEALDEKQVNGSDLYMLAEEIVRTVFEAMPYDKILSNQKQELTLLIQHCNHIEQLKALLKTTLGDCLDQLIREKENENIKPVRKAMQYVEKNYSERIVLNDIADLVDLNPAYFSVLFKKETGMNFSNYLIHIRMKKARELLCEGNSTISAIAAKVGYKDTRYFSQIFTKTVGIKPALYRKLYS